MMVVPRDTVVARGAVGRLRQPLNTTRRAVTVLVEARFLINRRFVPLHAVSVLLHGAAFEGVERQEVVFKVHNEGSALAHVAFLLGEERQLGLILMPVDDSWVAALDTPHEHGGQDPDCNIYCTEPGPHAFERVRDRQDVEPDHHEVDRVGHLRRCATL